MLHNRCKKILVIIFMGVFILLESCGVFAGTSLKDYRQGLLDQMRKETKISPQVKKGKYKYFIVKSKHFDILIDDTSLKHFNLTRGKELEDLVLRIAFILEEAHEVVNQAFAKSISGRQTIYCMSEAVKGGSGVTVYNTGRVNLSLKRDLMISPLDDFSGGISTLYNAYVRWYLWMVIGPGFHHQDTQRIKDYFIEMGQYASRWKQKLTEKKRNEILRLIDAKHTFLFKKYPQYFKNASINKKTMTCKWCKKEVDVTGKKKGQRILCPHCRNPIFVE